MSSKTECEPVYLSDTWCAAVARLIRGISAANWDDSSDLPSTRLWPSSPISRPACTRSRRPTPPPSLRVCDSNWFAALKCGTEKLRTGKWRIKQQSCLVRHFPVLHFQSPTRDARCTKPDNNNNDTRRRLMRAENWWIASSVYRTEPNHWNGKTNKKPLSIRNSKNSPSFVESTKVDHRMPAVVEEVVEKADFQRHTLRKKGRVQTWTEMLSEWCNVKHKKLQ